MMGLLLAATDPVAHAVQHTEWGLGSGPLSFPILSNHILMQVLAAALLVWLIPKAVRSRAGDDSIGRLVPRGWGNAVEAICVYLKKEVAEPNLGKYTPLFLPYLWSLFFFILMMNLLGLLPIADLLGKANPWHLLGGAATANIWVTAALAIVTLVMMVYNGLRYHGGAYIKHFFMGPPGVNVFIALLEFLGLFFKAMALAMRLFANMLGGHILLAVLLSLVSMAFGVNNAIGAGATVAVIVGSAAIYLLKLFVCFLQAFIFTMLTAVFVGMSVNIHHDDHGDEHGHDGHGHEAPAHH